ncbi:hypothetical protein JXA70_00725 [candidate division KSB1 bacterium]|nr:hypothetical protein [candidate division KSB1 bacterium]
MRIKKTILCMFLLLPFLLPARTNLQNVREQIEKLREERQEAAMEQNYDKSLKFFTDDVLIMPGLQQIIEGKKELKQRYERDKKEGVRILSIGHNVSADWLCDEDYYERGSWSMSVTSRDHPRPLAYAGSYLQIWEKQKDGSYKIKFNIWNLNHMP